MVNIFCYRHLWPTGNSLATLGDFHFRDLEVTLRGHPRSTHCGFRILATKILLMFLSNYGPISYRLGAAGDYICV